MFYRHLHAESCVLSREGEEAPKSELKTLRDERDRLQDELDVYRQAVQYVFEAINKFDDIQRKKAAMTPAGQRWTREMEGL